MLELAPGAADVFAADAASVDEYLAQIQEMTILTAIQVPGFNKRTYLESKASICT